MNRLTIDMISSVVGLVASCMLFYFIIANRRLYKRNRSLRQQIQELLDGHHCDMDEWRDINRRLAERDAMFKEMQEIGLFFRHNYTELELEQNAGKTTAQVVVLKLRECKEKHTK